MLSRSASGLMLTRVYSYGKLGQSPVGVGSGPGWLGGWRGRRDAMSMPARAGVGRTAQADVSVM